MSIRERIELCRLSYEISRNMEFSQKITISDISRFIEEEKNENRKEDTK